MTESKPNDQTSSASKLEWPASGRLASVDYGTVRIGIAICDPSRTWTNPLTTYNRRTEPLDRAFFQKLVRDEGIVGWVVGLPIHCDGLESQKSIEVRTFAVWLTTHTGLPVRFYDERFSSAQATRLLGPAELTKAGKKKRIDQVAAHLILENYLEFAKKNTEYRPEGLDD